MKVLPVNRRSLLALSAALLVPRAAVAEASDDAFLDEIERASFRFFWDQAAPATGQVKDRARAEGADTYKASSIAATGFGLTALCIADRRGWLAPSEIRDRVRVTLRFVYESLAQVHGFFFHFVDMHSGERLWKCELSSIDTALLLCGVLTCRQHFASDSEIPLLAARIYERVDWPWMLNGGETLSMGWMPESGFLKARWDHYCELMMLYLLGMGSPTHPLKASAWSAWRRPQVSFFEENYISGAPTLFTHQYSHAWFDFRKRRDAYADYFENSVKATRAHQKFCVSQGYSEDLWGVSASDSPNGYVAWGGPPAEGPIDGSVVPCAAGGSIPFLPEETIRVLRRCRAQGWCRYSFVDAFNPRTGWRNLDVLGIDLGITMLMAENHRSGFVWDTFMKNPEVWRGMQMAGFVAVG
ncbi:MAG: hypothetical protein FJX76_03075 [Armatimonadetes bacterium]|nr:hypothetical protein [Armatimonadota bacterium]